MDYFYFRLRMYNIFFLFIFQAVKEQKKRFEKLRSEFSKHLARNLNNLFIYHVRVNLFFFFYYWRRHYNIGLILFFCLNNLPLAKG